MKSASLVIHATINIWQDTWMNSAKVLLGIMLLNFSILTGCEGTLGPDAIPQRANKSLITNKEMNLSIENYVDKYLSEIVRFRNYNPDSVKKVFCVHHTVYVETAVTAPHAIQAYVKLLCAKGNQSSSNTVSISNLGIIVSKIYLQRYTQRSGQNSNPSERFQVTSEITPREMPFYIEDLRHYFSNEAIDKLDFARFDEKVDHEVIRQKVLEHEKNSKFNC